MAKALRPEANGLCGSIKQGRGRLASEEDGQFREISSDLLDSGQWLRYYIPSTRANKQEVEKQDTLFIHMMHCFVKDPFSIIPLSSLAQPVFPKKRE